VADAVSLHSLPLFVRMAGRPVMLLGEGEAADAKRRLLERAGATIVGEDAEAALAIVAIEDEATALAAGGALDPLGEGDVAAWLAAPAGEGGGRSVRIALRSADPDDLSLREARWLASADRVIHGAGVPAEILDRARADAARLPAPGGEGPGLTVRVEMA
jgi:hypothetical protein